MRQEARARGERERERRVLDISGWLSGEHANRRRRRHRHLHVELDQDSFCLFEKQISINI